MKEICRVNTFFKNIYIFFKVEFEFVFKVCIFKFKKTKTNLQKNWSAKGSNFKEDDRGFAPVVGITLWDNPSAVTIISQVTGQSQKNNRNYLC